MLLIKKLVWADFIIHVDMGKINGINAVLSGIAQLLRERTSNF
jgi:hypothetical protein